MEKMNEKYELLTDEEVAEWNNLRLQAQIDEMEAGIAEYLSERKKAQQCYEDEPITWNDDIAALLT